MTRIPIFTALLAAARRFSSPTANVASISTVCVAALLCVLLIPSVAMATFTRPFAGQVTGTPTGPGGTLTPFDPFTTAITTDSHGNLWVAEPEGPSGLLYKFNSAGVFQEALEPTFGAHEPEAKELKESATEHDDIAIEDSTGNIYSDGALYVIPNKDRFHGRVEVFGAAGNLLKRWPSFNDSHIAVDNSPETSLDPSKCTLSVCTVYVAHSDDEEPPYSDGLPRGVEKFSVNAAGEPTPASFTGSASYIDGSQITGTPNGAFHERPLGDIVVDPEGNIYVTVPEGSRPEAVYEYAPSGLFVREFNGVDTPNLSGATETGGFGEYHEHVEGLTVDPVSGHLLLVVNVDGGEPGGQSVVEEFSSAGVYLDDITETETSPGVRKHIGYLSNIVANSEGAIYTVESTFERIHETTLRTRAVVDMWGPGHFDPSVNLAEASQLKPTSAVLNGSVDPEGQKLNECHFEYVSESVFVSEGFTNASSAACTPDAAATPVDEAFHAVHAEAVDLESGTTYRYRLTVHSEGALGGSAASAPLAFTAPARPRVDSTSVANVSSRFADLHAQIDSLGADTTYHFEYDTREYTGSESHGVSVPVPDEDIGRGGPTGSADASVVQQIGGLAPDTTYYYRVVAVNEIGLTVGAACGGGSSVECTFTTLPQTSEALPDDRAYELVTPPNKGSAEDMFVTRGITKLENQDVGYPSESGEEFLFETGAAFGDAEHPFAASGQNAYVFRRSAQAKRWLTFPLASPELGIQSVVLSVFDPLEFSRVGIVDVVGSKPSVGGVREVGLLGAPGGPYQTAISTAQEPEFKGAKQVIVGSSRDLSRLVLETENPALLPPGQRQGSSALYEWNGSGECTPEAANCALVSVEPNGSPFACGAGLGFGLRDVQGGTHDAVSEDGSKMFFTAPDPSDEGFETSKGCWDRATGKNSPQVYMRTGEETLKLSTPEGGFSPLGPVKPATYVGASEDGSKVFFVTETELTGDDAGHDTGSNAHDPELYMCEIVQEAGGEHRCKLTRISAGESGDAEGHVWTVPAVSADGSMVYFTAYGALAQGATALPVENERGPVNLYGYDTIQKTVTYIGRVDARDYPANRLPAGIALAPDANWYTTPDGRYLLFASTGELTGYDTLAASPGDCKYLDQQDSLSSDCMEVYRYDARAAEKGEPSVICVSCDRSGARPVSDAFFGHAAGLTAPQAGPVRAMSDNGSCVFFDSADPLVKQAENKMNDVFEWEADGSGHCEVDPQPPVSICEQAQGCVNLISSGEDPTPSYFLGASANGANVFFGTHSKLVPQDTDESGDLYDARIEGGFGVSAGVGPCEGDACQSPPSAPIDATPGSLTFSGQGNIAPSPEIKTAVKSKAKTLKCKKGFVKKKDKCVKGKPQKRSKAAKKARRTSQKRRAKR